MNELININQIANGYAEDWLSLVKSTQYWLIFEKQIRYQPTWSEYQKEPIDYSNYQIF